MISNSPRPSSEIARHQSHASGEAVALNVLAARDPARRTIDPSRSQRHSAPCRCYRNRDRSGASADIGYAHDPIAALRFVECQFDEHLRLWPRDERCRRTCDLEPEELTVSDDVRQRFAVPAPRDEGIERSQLRLSDSSSRMRASRCARSVPEHMHQQHLGIDQQIVVHIAARRWTRACASAQRSASAIVAISGASAWADGHWRRAPPRALPSARESGPASR